DPDDLSDASVTSVYSSTTENISRPKIQDIGEHLRHVAPDAEVEGLRGLITREPIARRLGECDIVFGCTDDNAGRLVLSRLTTYLLIPVIDCGVLLTSGIAGVLEGIHGRVTVLVPEQACLVCRDRIDLRR